MLDLRAERLDGASGQKLLPEFFAEGERVYGFSSSEYRGPSATADELSPPTGAFLVAYLDDEPVGCGGIKRLSDDAAELKRLYVVPNVRNQGIARDLIAALEDSARQVGYRLMRLDTGNRQPAALHLFRSVGYREIDDYNGNPHARYWFEKRL